jgi:hypothetical protein
MPQTTIPTWPQHNRRGACRDVGKDRYSAIPDIQIPGVDLHYSYYYTIFLVAQLDSFQVLRLAANAATIKTAVANSLVAIPTN